MKSGIPVYDIQNLKIYHKNGVLVSRFKPYLKEHQHLLAPHRHNFYHLVFFTEGTGSQQIDFKTYGISPNTIYFMVPGQVHQWHFDTEVDGYIVNFSANYFANFLVNVNYIEKYPFFSGNSDEQTVLLNESLIQRCFNCFEGMLDTEGFSDELAGDFIKASLLKLFSMVASQIPRATEPTYNHTLIQNFRKLIEANYKKLKLPKDYANLLYITPNHLNAVCKDFLGETAGILIRDRIILETKRMLTNLDRPIAEIADDLGFDDQSYFIKFFKKVEGLTPEKFRKINFIKNDSTT